MFFQSKITNFKRLSRTASNIAIISATAMLAPNLVMAAERHNTTEKPPTIELHFEVLDNISNKKKDPFAPAVNDSEVKHDDVFSAPTNMPFSTKPSEPLPENLRKKLSNKVKKTAKPTSASAKVETKPEQKQEIKPIPVPTTEAVKESPKLDIPDVSLPTTSDSERKSAPIIVPTPAPKEPELPIAPSTDKIDTKTVPAIIPPATPKEPELPVPPKTGMGAEPVAEPREAPALGKIEPPVPAVPDAAAPKPEPLITPIIPTDDTNKLPVPPATKVEAKPDPVIAPVITAPKEPELPVPSKPEASSNGKVPSVAITPMPPAPTPTEEFMKALNVPVEADKKPAPETKPIEKKPVIPSGVKPAITPVTTTEPAKEEPAKPATPTGNLLLSIKFISTETTLPISAEEDLKKVAETLKKQNKRVTLFSYASESADQATTARRVSLSRVLAVRAFLLENGVDKLNINVRAEGSKNPGGEPNRVDITVNDEKSN